MRLKKQTIHPPVSDELILWVQRNRGVIKEVAEMVRPVVTPAYVSMVAHGKKKSRDGRVERELRKKGAPL